MKLCRGGGQGLHSVLHIYAALALSFFAGSVSAVGSWKVVPGVEVAEIYTDNYELSGSAQERDEYITEISPNVSVVGGGANLKVNAFYRLQTLSHARESDRNTVNHILDLRTESEILEDNLFLDLDASIRQELVSSDGLITLDSYNQVNRDDVYTLHVSPYVKNDFNGYMDTIFRYTRDSVRYERGAADSDINMGELALASGRHFSRLTWWLNYRDERVEREDINDIGYISSSAEVRYNLSSMFSVFARGGSQDYDLDNVSEGVVENGSYWVAGAGVAFGSKLTINAASGNNYDLAEFLYTPSNRTSVKVTWIDTDIGINRGEIWGGELNLRTRRATWKASYQENTTSSQQQQFVPAQVVLVDDAGNLVVDRAPIDSDQYIVLGNTSLTNSVFVEKIGRVSMGYRTGKSTWLFSLFDSKREFIDSTNHENSIGGNLSWKYNVTARSTLDVLYNMQAIDFVGTAREDELDHMSVGLTWNLSPRSSLSGRLSNSDLSSTLSQYEYEENRLQVRFSTQF